MAEVRTVLHLPAHSNSGGLKECESVELHRWCSSRLIQTLPYYHHTQLNIVVVRQIIKKTSHHFVQHPMAQKIIVLSSASPAQQQAYSLSLSCCQSSSYPPSASSSKEFPYCRFLKFKSKLVKGSVIAFQFSKWVYFLQLTLFYFIYRGINQCPSGLDQFVYFWQGRQYLRIQWTKSYNEKAYRIVWGFSFKLSMNQAFSF